MNLDKLKDRFDAYEKLMRLDKPIGILLLLWPTLWGIWIASRGRPDLMVLWIFILGTVLMRSAGCVINDYADRDFDDKVERTQHRPMATGRVSKREALLLAGGLAFSAGLLILPLNPLVWWMSVPALLLAGTYPFTKRFLPIPQAYLGLAFSFGIPMAFAAFQNTVPAYAWYLVVANLFWVVAYDTEYAMVDKPDDLKIGIKTSAITFGRFDAEAVMICHGLFLLGMGLIGWLLHRGVFWYVGLTAAAVLIALQYRMIRGRDRAKCFQAFLDNNWVGAATFAGIAMDYWLAIPF
ncbi:4-hydroxybenzoate octaprenyltransferase [Chitinimonas sp. BJYL2]|uniref:4-hydroxybenzoate octaprenyltransferase n=1 Tax=Chitinimonas sp. BJYL2 TaxID=2976696 RepID=UPI0022B3974C|nr:4-hydroxybenzoate octaprenyltransferase [Chitinimonas sp. BJYL2]